MRHFVVVLVFSVALAPRAFADEPQPVSSAEPHLVPVQATRPLPPPTYTPVRVHDGSSLATPKLECKSCEATRKAGLVVLGTAWLASLAFPISLCAQAAGGFTVRDPVSGDHITPPVAVEVVDLELIPLVGPLMSAAMVRDQPVLLMLALTDELFQIVGLGMMAVSDHFDLPAPTNVSVAPIIRRTGGGLALLASF